MASDPPDDTENDDDEAGTGVDHEELRSIIREELTSVLGEFDFSGGGKPSDDDSGDEKARPATVRDIEAATNQAVRKAMADLNRKPRKQAPKAEKVPPEPEPVNPPKGIGERVREALWG